MNYLTIVFGFIFATYLYDLSLGDKSRKVAIFQHLISALSVITTFGDLTDDNKHISRHYNYIGSDVIQYLEKTGLPIVKNGRLSISDEDIDSICSAFYRAMLRDFELFKRDNPEQIHGYEGTRDEK